MIKCRLFGRQRFLKRRMVFFAIAVLLVGEFSTRISGLTNFPLYDIDARVGYIPSKNQSGTFLNRNRVRFQIADAIDC